MNEKLAKSLRAAAGYRNASAHPNPIPFPGVARMYLHPVPETRAATRTSYEYKDGRWVKVFRRVKALSVFNGRAPTQKIQLVVATRPFVDPETGEEGQVPVYDENRVPVRVPKPELAQVPVTKPARLDPKSPKGVYRALKKLARDHRITDLYQFLRDNPEVLNVPLEAAV